jgi:hypothetical protein
VRKKPSNAAGNTTAVQILRDMGNGGHRGGIRGPEMITQPAIMALILCSRVGWE